MRLLPLLIVAVFCGSVCAEAGVGVIYLKAPGGEPVYVDGIYVGNCHRDGVTSFFAEGLPLQKGQWTNGWNVNAKSIVVTIGFKTGWIYNNGGPVPVKLRELDRCSFIVTKEASVITYTREAGAASPATTAEVAGARPADVRAFEANYHGWLTETIPVAKNPQPIPP